MKKHIVLSKSTIMQIKEMSKIVGGNDDSTMAPLTDCGNCLPVQDKVCPPLPILKLCTLSTSCSQASC